MRLCNHCLGPVLESRDPLVVAMDEPRDEFAANEQRAIDLDEVLAKRVAHRVHCHMDQVTCPRGVQTHIIAVSCDLVDQGVVDAHLAFLAGGPNGVLLSGGTHESATDEVGLITSDQMADRFLQDFHPLVIFGQACDLHFDDEVKGPGELNRVKNVVARHQAALELFDFASRGVMRERQAHNGAHIVGHHGSQGRHNRTPKPSVITKI